MELSQRTHKASKEDLDIFSSMPDNVVTNILDRLPIQDAVRTGILSRNWRFKWNMLSQLVFDEDFFKYLLKSAGEDDHGRIISRLLFHIKGAITKFVLFLDEGRYSVDVRDISHWILFLSRKGVKDLTLKKGRATHLKLPSHLFSCLGLEHLKLVRCCCDPPTSFHGFPNLLSLELWVVKFERVKILEFFTGCPLLETLNMGRLPLTCGVKVADIAKLANLKVLSLFLSNLDNASSNTIFELVGFLPKLQQLNLDFLSCKLTEDGVKKRLPTTLFCLKTLKLSTIDLRDDTMLLCAFEMIWSFPDLQTLEITGNNWDAVQPRAICSLEVDNDTMGLLQLRSVVFTYCKASENEVGLIKYLLACSPFLKKVVIRLLEFQGSDEKFKFSRKLLKLYRASPLVDIDLY